MTVIKLAELASTSTFLDRPGEAKPIRLRPGGINGAVNTKGKATTPTST